MDYEFRRHSLTGTLMAEFSMEHAILGRWFTDELVDDAELIQKISAAILLIQNKKQHQWQHIGRDLTLSIESDQVQVYTNALITDSDAERVIDEALSLYDAESCAGCGLEDFLQVFASWQQFLQEKN